MSSSMPSVTDASSVGPARSAYHGSFSGVGHPAPLGSFSGGACPARRRPWAALVAAAALLAAWPAPLPAAPGGGLFDLPKDATDDHPATRPAKPRPEVAPFPMPEPAPGPDTTKPVGKPKPGPAPAATKPATRPAGHPKPAELASAVDAAIQRGLAYLYAAQAADGSWDTKYAAQHPGGVEALAVLAALSAGEKPTQANLAAALKFAGAQKATTVYVRAVRAMVYSKLPAATYAAPLEEDAQWLASMQGPSGGWGYGPGYRAPTVSWSDNSNTFLAMLALREAAAAGAKVPAAVWSKCRPYWSRAANPDGGLSYQPPGNVGFRLRGSSYGSMTAAGLTGLLLLTDKWAALNEPPFAAGRANTSPYQKAFDGAVKWLQDNYVLKENPKWVWGTGKDGVAAEAYEDYYLWCLQLLADEGGIRGFGTEDMARSCADLIVTRQRPAGNWDDPAAPGAEDKLTAIRTCFSILALTRAKSPVLINRLGLTDGAPNDSRDAANLTAWITRKLGWPGCWRQVTVETPEDVLAAAPVLYIHTNLKEYPAVLGTRIRTFLAGGGTIIVQPFAGDAEVAEAAKAFLTAQCPEYVGADVPDGHPVFSVMFKIPAAARPKAFGFSDGLRTRVFLLTGDASGPWHQNRQDEYAGLFQFAANVLLYTTDLTAPKGKLRLLAQRNKPPRPERTIGIARVRHGGDWNVCPGVADRLSEVLASALSVGVKELPAVDLSRPVDPNVPMLWLTGTREAKLIASQRSRLKEYVVAGGTLLVDSAMGGGEFHDAELALVIDTFGPGSVQSLPADHPLLTGSFADGMGSNLTRVQFTRAAAEEAGDSHVCKLMGVLIGGRVGVVISPLSVVCPLLSEPVYGCRGLAPPDACRLAANVLLYAATNAQAATSPRKPASPISARP
jgi:hypothetical protein